MDLREALSGISAYSSVQNLPLIGIKGLRIYVKGAKSPDQKSRMEQDLRAFRDRFCRVFELWEKDENGAMAANVSVFRGIRQLYQNNDPKLVELRNRIISLRVLIDKILSEETVSKSSIKPYFSDLSSISRLAASSGRRMGREGLFVGKFPLRNN